MRALIILLFLCGCASRHYTNGDLEGVYVYIQDEYVSTDTIVVDFKGCKTVFEVTKNELDEELLWQLIMKESKKNYLYYCD